MSDLAALESRFRRLAEIRLERDEQKAMAKKVEAEYREYEAELIALVEDSSLKGSIEFDFGGDLGKIAFGSRKTIYGRVINKNAARSSLAAEGLFDQMTGTSFESARINELAREREETGEDMPEGLDFYEKRFISITHKK